MKANEIERLLLDFNENDYTKILINGSWGIGKTHYIKKYQEENSNVCYVSLFGKKDINSIIQEIYFRFVSDAGYLKDKFAKVKTKMSKLKQLNLNLAGIGVSIPMLETSFESIKSTLKKNQNSYIIIFDDLERKHPDLDIKEVFGLLDGLAEINDIKTVLIAAEDKLSENDSINYKEFKEKAIERSYSIMKYADEAPEKILGFDVWDTIKGISEKFESNNLRTFEKTNLFIKEIKGLIGNDVFNSKFSKDDLYRMCFASIIFVVDHKEEKKLLNSSEDNLTTAFYKDNDTEYTFVYLLESNLDNKMNKLILECILESYKTGAYSKNKIMKAINSVMEFDYKPNSLYSSEEDVLNMIAQSEKHLNNLKGNEDLETILTEVKDSLNWSDALSIEFSMSNDQILECIKPNISNMINIEDQLHLNKLEEMYYIAMEKNRSIKNLVEKINLFIEEEYINQLLMKISTLFEKEDYRDPSYLFQLKNHIINLQEGTTDLILDSLRRNNFFFPVPSKRINENLWYWCRLIKFIVLEIEKHWDLEDYYKDFISIVYSMQNVEEDKMLKHRLKLLFENQ
ncbi:P-loop NTPase fold protein [Virgibacillus salexigens]|uniref:KAP family P-loop domain protein n=1 Tax=Virgibacillus massiliensis TaxID=1462526 RepID=A0A024QIF1_9BACI|nr:P-loop NTPase fold protein [Virgibacillus massiliensis]CDQ41741.1 KAP family P-loop domain protein [Virgibacillus massiliensis]